MLNTHRITAAATVVGAALCLLVSAQVSTAQLGALPRANARTQDKMVKVYGVGGRRGLESYQSGFLITEDGHFLTAWSYVLDTDTVTAVLNDGRRFDATLVGADPRLEIAVMKLEAEGLSFFALDEAVELTPGSPVLAFSNLYSIAVGNEPSSLLHGIVSAVTRLSARRGTYETPYDGPIYLLDAMTNNAGAAGGVLTDYEGRLAGILGKELRSADADIWINYALPINEVRDSVNAILAGESRPRSESSRRLPEESITLASLGLVLLPNVVPKTPPYVDQITPDSPAARAGLRPDDLIIIVSDRVIQSRSELEEELTYIDRLDAVTLTVQREQSIIEVRLAIEKP